MIPYAILFISFLSLYFSLEIASWNRKISSMISFIPMLPLVVFAFFYAGEIGSDAENYNRLFGIAEELPQEPIFSLLLYSAKSLGLDFIEFSKLLVLSQFLLLTLIIRRLREPLLFLLFYFGCFYLNFHFNALRNSTAILLIGAVLVQFRRVGLITILISSLIHYSSLVTIALQKLSQSGRKRLAISVLVLASIMIILIWLNRNLIADIPSSNFYYSGYFQRDAVSGAIYPALLLKLVVMWLLFLNGGNRILFAAYAIFVVLIHATDPIFSRISDLILFLAVLDFCTHHQLVRKRLLTIGLTSILVLSSFMVPMRDCQSSGYDDNWCLLVMG